MVLGWHIPANLGALHVSSAAMFDYYSGSSIRLKSGEFNLSWWLLGNACACVSMVERSMHSAITHYSIIGRGGIIDVDTVLRGMRD